MLNFNVDRIDEAYNTAAPFQQNSSLRIGSISISPGMIHTIKIGCKPGIKLPIRLYGVYIPKDSPNCCMVQFSDSHNTIIGTCRMWLASATAEDMVTKAILDTEGALLGHMSFNKSLPALLIAAARIAGGSVQTKANDFVLLPDCFTPWITGYGKVLKVNDRKTLCSLVIKPGILTRAEYSQGSYKMGVIGVYNGQAMNNYICKLTVDNVVKVNGTALGTAAVRSFWVGGRHLVIHSGLTSNLRVVCEGSFISLRGVTDG